MRLNPKTRRHVAVLAGMAMGAAFFAAPARADVVGELVCNIAPGEGQLIVSQRAASCVFQSPSTPPQRYRGAFSRIGVDIGNQTGARLVYNVVAIGNPAPGALSGAYAGPGFGLSLGAGGGGLNALVGGGNSFVLQPISATTSTGVNFNAGVGGLQLAYVGLDQGGRLRRHGASRHHGLRHHGRRRHTR